MKINLHNQIAEIAISRYNKAIIPTSDIDNIIEEVLKLSNTHPTVLEFVDYLKLKRGVLTWDGLHTTLRDEYIN